MASVQEQLDAIRSTSGARRTVGLDNTTVCQFVTNDPTLADAVNAATESRSMSIVSPKPKLNTVSMLALPSFNCTR